MEGCKIMSEEPSLPSSPADSPDQEAAAPVFAPYNPPAGGWGALRATANALREQSIVLKGSKTLLSMNQPDGFDCPGCAWPDPRHTSSFEFCENGAKAVAWELTKHRVTREFFATHTVRQLELESDYWLEQQGRLTEPMRYDPATDHYVPVGWVGMRLSHGSAASSTLSMTPTRPSSTPRDAPRTRRHSCTSCSRAVSARTTSRIARTCATSRPASAFPKASASARGPYCSTISPTPRQSLSSVRTRAPTARGC